MPTLTVVEMRKKLKKRYHNAEKWCKKVDKMSDTQVFAIWMNFINRNEKYGKEKSHG